jgi:hypothetical protein
MSPRSGRWAVTATVFNSTSELGSVSIAAGVVLYWEAGFAEGLGKPGIYICEADGLDRARGVAVLRKRREAHDGARGPIEESPKLQRPSALRSMAET